MRQVSARTAALPAPAPPTPDEWSATRIAVAILGSLLAFAGIEHGVGEILQGPTRPPFVVFKSWPNSDAFAVVNGEPAMSVIPNLLISGVLTILVALALAVWSIGFAHRRPGGLVLLGLSILLLLVGGGFGPPLIGILISSVAGRPAAANPAGPLSSALSRLWPWPLAVAVLSFLGLVPGMVLLRHFAGVDQPGVVTALILLAFTGLVLALATARARDRIVLHNSH